METQGLSRRGLDALRMEIRGDRECKECGTRWSYYDTGEVACPECGSVQSVGVDDDRALHTTTAATLDLADARASWARASRDEAVDVVKAACRSFTRGNGFVHAGDLQALDGRFVGARELENAADVAGRRQALADEESYYVLSLLESIEDGSRPSAAEVPRGMRSARGLAVADTVERYRRDVRRWLDATERDVSATVTDALSSLETHQKRVQALQGDVDPRHAEALYTAARELGAFIREEGDIDEIELVGATDRLADIGD